MNKFKTRAKFHFDGEIEVNFPEEHHFDSWDAVLKYAADNKESIKITIPKELLPHGGKVDVKFSHLELFYDIEITKEDE